MSEREIILPESDEAWLKLRTKDITSTEIAALFGISPYMTSYELWHRKKNAEVVELEPNARMVWGNRLQDAIAKGICADNKWSFRQKTEYMRLPTLRMGSSFDYELGGLEVPGILEIKNVDSLAYKEGWLINGDSIEAPPHIELQVQHQLLVSGYGVVYIGALVGGNRVTLIRREPDVKIHDQIRAKAAEFWYSIDNNIEPKPDFTKDADFITALQKYAEPGKVMDATGDRRIASLVKEYKHWGEKQSDADKQKKGVKAELLTLIGNAEKVIADWGTISAGTTPPTLVEAYQRESFRNFRVNLKKEKPL